MASEKVSLRIEKELILMLMEKYVGKKPPRIGKEVAEAFRQSGCSIFVDLFGGSLAMLCYLPLDVKVVVNDINGSLVMVHWTGSFCVMVN